MQDINRSPAIVICIRPTCSELGDKIGTGLEDPVEDLGSAVLALLAGRQGQLVARDENQLVCVVGSAAEAFSFTQELHRAVAKTARRQWLGLRIGCYGAQPADARSDAWATAIQCAQQLANRATLGQTLASTSSLSGLDTALLAETTPLGDSDWACDQTGIGLPLCLIHWQEEVPTRIAVPALKERGITRVQRLRLRWRGENRVLEQDSLPLTLGRSTQADIFINSEYASRIHASLSYVNTGFVLTDRSTNGTYVKMDNDAEMYLHDDEVILRGEGCISLGRRTSTAMSKVVFFKAELTGETTGQPEV